MEATIGSWHIEVERIPLTQPELVAMYDRAATHWHRSVRRLGYGRAYAALLARLGQEGELDGVATGEVLDCGIGTGALSLALAEVGLRPARLHGIDTSPRMLEEARWTLQGAGLNAELQRRDLRELPFDNSRFALVMCAHALEHLPDPEPGLREMFRVLRPGAPLVLIATRRGVLGACMHLRWRNACLRPSAMQQMADEVGLTGVRVFPLSGAPCAYGGSSLVLVGRKPDRSMDRRRPGNEGTG